MANLSNLLGDVYGEPAPPEPAPPEAATDDPGAAPAERVDPTESADTADTAEIAATVEIAAAVEGTEASEGDRHPEWAGEDRLDEAFSEWTAGEMPGDPTRYDFTDETADDEARASAEPAPDHALDHAHDPATAGRQLSDLAAAVEEAVAAEVASTDEAHVDVAAADGPTAEAAIATEPEPEGTAAAPAASSPRRWSPELDDVLPTGSLGGRLFRLGRR